MSRGAAGPRRWRADSGASTGTALKIHAPALDRMRGQVGAAVPTTSLTEWEETHITARNDHTYYGLIAEQQRGNPRRKGTM